MTDIFYSLESEVRSYSRSWPVEFVQASGATQTDASGTEYLDFFSGAGALNYGHNNPVVMEPLIEYLQSGRSEEHTSELQSRGHLVCRLLLEKKKKAVTNYPTK